MENLERAKRIEKALINMSDTEYGTWYAIHISKEDQDDGLGSISPLAAAIRAVKCGAYEIALIYDNGSDETYATLKLDEVD